MSELEKKSVNEMDAAEMLKKHREEHPEEYPDGDRTEGGGWAEELIRELHSDSKKWHHRQGWNAFGLGLLSVITAASCAAALTCGLWRPIVTAIGLVNLVLAGGWWQKAKAGWNA